MKKAIICITVLLVLVRTSAFSQVFYKITSPGSLKVSYLFGTVHGATSIILIPEEVEKRLAESKVLYLEVLEAVSKSAEANRLSQHYTLYPQGMTIKDHLSADEYNLLKRAFTQTGRFSDSLFEKELSKFQPYFLNGVYVEARLNQPVFAGLDFKLERMARKKGIRHFRTFETPEEMASFHAQMAAKLSPSFFVSHLDSLYDRSLEIEKAYIAQDTTLLQNDADAILVHRNMQWAKALKTPLEKGGVFIAVGAAHLAGGSGLVTLLRQAGCKIEAITVPLVTLVPVKQ